MTPVHFTSFTPPFRLQFFAITGELFWHLGHTFPTVEEAKAKGEQVAASPGYRVVDEREVIAAERRSPMYEDQEPRGPNGIFR